MPKRELRLGRPCEGCLAVARRAKADLTRSWRALHHVECPERPIGRSQAGRLRVEGLMALALPNVRVHFGWQAIRRLSTLARRAKVDPNASGTVRCQKQLGTTSPDCRPSVTNDGVELGDGNIEAPIHVHRARPDIEVPESTPPVQACEDWVRDSGCRNGRRNSLPPQGAHPWTATGPRLRGCGDSRRRASPERGEGSAQSVSVRKVHVCDGMPAATLRARDLVAWPVIGVG
jgi:hypothetical protein